jgi:hypothetical protein
MVPTGFKASGGGENLQDLLWTLPEPESIGASTYVIVLETDAEGACGYLPEPDRPRLFKLGKSFGATRLGFIHTLRTMLLLDPATNSLRGLAAFFEGHLRVYLFGTLWGIWIDEEGRRHNVKTPLAELHSPKLFIRVNDSGERLRVEFGVGKNNPEMFPASVRKRLRQGDTDFRIALDFSIPSGKFHQAEIVAVQPDTGVTVIAHPVEGFPLRWPQLASVRSSGRPERPRAAAPPPPTSTAEQKKPGAESGPKPGVRPNAAGMARPAEPAASTPRAASPPPLHPPASPQQPPRMTPPPVAAPGPTPSPSMTPPQSQQADPQPASRLRSGPRLRLRPRTPGEASPPPAAGPRAPSGSVRTPWPLEASPRRPAGAGEDSIVPPPPSAKTSYRLRPGQLSDPLGRKSPLPVSDPTPAQATGDRGAGRREEPPPRARPEPIPRTDQLSTRELIEVLQKESDPDRRWKMIEPNLIMGRAERTYSLIANFAELISERSPEWPAARLRSAFASQPGAVLVGIMDRWHMNQVLAVTESNSESAKILQWLREREVERMLRLPLDREISSAGEARRALRVDRAADEASIRKTWRILLQFLNADHGRSDEKAIHRQKDEIAKYLQTARDYLLRVTVH